MSIRHVISYVISLCFKRIQSGLFWENPRLTEQDRNVLYCVLLRTYSVVLIRTVMDVCCSLLILYHLQILR